MALKSKSSTLNTYGITKGVEPWWSQVNFDAAAFAAKLPTEKILMRRSDLFRRVAEGFLKSHFEWHSWTDKVVDTLCYRSVACFPGAAGCVSGDTRILNPITGEQPTIRHLCGNRIAPTVQTLAGAIQAEVPFIKGVEELFEITLDNGTKFEATAEHRVLAFSSNASRWFRVGDLQIGQFLLSYEQVRSQSISEPCLLTHASDAHDSPKIIANYQANYSSDFHPCGEQLHFSEDNAQSFFPSQGDVPVRNRRSSYSDGSVKGFGHNRVCQPSFPRSRSDFESHSAPLDNHEPIPLNPESFLRDDQTFQRAGQSQRAIGQIFQVLKPTHDSFGKQSYQLRVSQARILSIRNTGKQLFYDIHVPGVQHYFAEGAIHHNSAKTFNVISFATLWWMCSPYESSVTLVSTSKGSLRQRGWAEVQRVYSRLGLDKIGNFVDSQMTWQVERGDTKHAIKCKAVEEGPIQKVADDIKGVHTARQMVVVDEATSVPKAIYEACENLHSYPREFILVLIGNPPASKLNQFSQYCEPKEGWQSVDLDTDAWEGKPIAALSNLTPYVVRFDAEKSPNIVEGKKVSKHLPTKEKVQAAREAGGGQTPSYWSNFRGFWPPEGLAKTVFSASLLDLGDAYGSFVFDGDKFFVIGAFDPAFGGGDRPALRFAKLGTNAEGKWGIQSYPAKIIPILATSKNPVHFQLAESVRRECENCTFEGMRFPCPPENLAIDASGEGGGLCDIIQRTWSPYIMRVEFGGAASEDPCNLEDCRPAREVYENKSVEMAFRTRDAVNAGQLKGIDKDTAEEMCNRQFSDTGKRIRLQSKSRDKSAAERSYKSMFGKSPDLFDCEIMLSEVARRKGFRLAAVGQTIHRTVDWEKEVQKVQEFYETDQFQEEEIGEDDMMYA